MDVDENNAVLKKIGKSYIKDRLIPFIGAGFSKNAKLKDCKEYPGWKEFVDDLYGKDKNREFEDPLLNTEYWIAKSIRKSKPKLSSKAWFKKCRKKLGERVGEFFKQFKLKDNQVSKEHQILVNKFDTIYTSNWDDLLEKALEGCCKSDMYSVFYEYSHFHNNGMLKKEKQIIKIHGCIADSPDYDSLVATRSDYYDRMITMHPIYLKFQHAVSFHDFIFIGFSFEDPNISYLLQQLNFMKTRTLKTKRKGNHNIFLAMKSESYDEKKKSTLRKLFLNSFNIKIYFYENLSGFLNNLKREK